MVERFKRIGVSDRWVNFLDRAERYIEESPPEKSNPTNFGYNLQTRVVRMMELAVGHYLLDETDESKSWAEAQLTESQRYFFGDWRKNMEGRGAEYWANGGGRWFEVYRTSMAFASALGNHELLKRLSEFPNDDKAEDNVVEWKSDLGWSRLLAEYFARGITDAYDRRLAEVLDGTAKWPRTLAEMLDAIVRKRSDDVPRKFAEHFKYYLKTVRKRFDAMFQLDMDGTVLYHLAARLGRPFELDEKTRDHLIIFG